MAANGADRRFGRYLLGHLSLEEEERLEVEYLTGEDAFALVQEAEHDLIDDYVGGRLSADDVRRFEERVLPRPEMAGRVAFARALAAAKAPVGGSVMRPWLGAAAAAVLAVVSTGLGAGLVSQERAAARAHEAAEARIRDLEGAVAAQQARVDAVPPPQAAEGAPRVYELRGGAQRGDPGGAVEIEAPGAGWVGLRLPVGEHLYPSYVATLETAEERRLATLPVVRIDAPAVAEVMVPAALLKEGAYVVLLHGIEGAARDPVDGFPFQVRPARAR